MPGFQQEAVVQIYEGTQPLGSGYDLGNGRVLTARHVIQCRDASDDDKVLGERARVCVRREGSVDGPAMRVAWRGAAKLDVAVLCPADEGDEASEPPLVWLFDGDARGRDWFARGFPAILGDHAEPVEGRIPSGQDPMENGLRLLVEAPPPEAKDWLGLSGAAVFVADRLFAVVTSVSKVFRGSRLKAVPVVALLRSNEELRAAVGLPTLGQRRAKVLEQVKARLSSARIRGHLAAGSAKWKPFVGDAARMAETIVDESSALDLAKGFNRAMYEASKTASGEAATALREVFEHALPYVVGSCSAAHDGVGVREIGTQHPHVVEAHMAWERGGSMRMRRAKKPEAYFKPEGYVELAPSTLPEDGMGEDGFAEAVAEDIATRSKALADVWFERDGNEDLFAHQAWDRKLRSINAQMKAMQDILFFALARSAEQRSEQDFLAFLAQKLDALRVVVPRLATEEDEQVDDELLTNIGQLYRYYQDTTGPRT